MTTVLSAATWASGVGRASRARACPSRMVPSARACLTSAGRRSRRRRIGHRHAALAHPLGHLLLGQPELVHQLLEGRRLLQGVEVGALDVLHQGQLQHLLGRGLLDHGRHRRQPGQARRLPAPLAGDELVALRPLLGDDQRLDQAMLADRGGQLGQGLGVEGGAGLHWVGRDGRHRHLRHAAGRLAPPRGMRASSPLPSPLRLLTVGFSPQAPGPAPGRPARRPNRGHSSGSSRRSWAPRSAGRCAG